MGDLHLKRGDQASAIEAYGQVAEQFSKSGFDAKAVAIYKQILKIDPAFLKARTALGDHFQRMGLTVDALREFQEAIKTCQERGLKREAFDLLKRVAALDPANVPNRLSLADLLLREKLQGEARQEYVSLLDEVQGEPESVLRVAERMIDAFPDELSGWIAFANANIALGDADSAHTRLSQAAGSFPDSIELHEVLVRVQEARGDQDGISSAYRSIAELYKQRGDEDKARDILQRFVSVERLSSDRTPSSPSLPLTDECDGTTPGKIEFDSGGLDFSELAGDAEEIELVAEDPVIATTPRLAKGKPAAGDAEVEELLAEARVCLDFDDPDDAARLAKKVLAIDAGNEDAREILAQLKKAAKAKARPAAAKQALPAKKSAAAKPAARKAAPGAAAKKPAPRARPADVFDDGGDNTQGFADSLPDIELVLEDEVDFDDELASIEPPTHVDLAPIGPDKHEDAPATSDSEFEIDFTDDDEPEDEIEVEAPERAGGASSRSWAEQSSWVTENIEQAEFFFQQGMFEEAERAFKEVLDRVPRHPQALVRMGELEVRRSAAQPAALEIQDPNQTQVEALDDAPEDDLDDPGQIEFEDADAIELEPPKPEPKPEPKPGPKPKKAPAKPPAAQKIGRAKKKPEPEPVVEEEGGLDLAEELSAELEEAAAGIAGETVDEEAELFDPGEMLEPDTDGTPEPASEPGEDFDLAAALDDDDQPQIDMESSGVGFEEVFKAFKKGISEELGEGEVDAHYDLAIAYKEMGLLEDAVEQLELVRRSEEHRLEGLSLMAICKVELGRPQEAAGHLAEALAVVPEDDESVVALRYDLGEALLAAGKKGEALDAFRKVAAADDGYRDVQERIEELA